MEHKQALVSICVPSREFWRAEFGMSLCRAQAYAITQGILPYVHLRTGSVIADLRNSLVEAALAIDNCSHILFIDDDQMFPATTIELLVKRDTDIVGANIARKEPNPRTNSRELAPEGFEGKGSCAWTLPQSTKIQEVDYVGTGLIMIKRHVFEKMPKPWFFYDVHSGVGEDAGFCIKARDYGFKTYIDHDLSKDVKHVGSFYYGMEHTDRWQLELSLQKEREKNGNK